MSQCWKKHCIAAMPCYFIPFSVFLGRSYFGVRYHDFQAILITLIKFNFLQAHIVIIIKKRSNFWELFRKVRLLKKYADFLQLRIWVLLSRIFSEKNAIFSSLYCLSHTVLFSQCVMVWGVPRLSQKLQGPRSFPGDGSGRPRML